MERTSKRSRRCEGCSRWGLSQSSVSITPMYTNMDLSWCRGPVDSVEPSKTRLIGNWYYGSSGRRMTIMDRYEPPVCSNKSLAHAVITTLPAPARANNGSRGRGGSGLLLTWWRGSEQAREQHAACSYLHSLGEGFHWSSAVRHSNAHCAAWARREGGPGEGMGALGRRRGDGGKQGAAPGVEQPGALRAASTAAESC